jgi:hypothetical protein
MNQLLQIDQVLALQSTSSGVPSDARLELGGCQLANKIQSFRFARCGHRAGSHPD